MARTLDEVIGSLPEADQTAINTRYLELQDEVDTLSAVRRLVGLSQQQLADTLNMKQPTLSKLERNTDMYLSTLRRYVEALGGNLDIVISVPGHAPLKLKQFSDVSVGEMSLMSANSLAA